MNENRCASAAEACNLLLGLLIVAQFPIMFGMASGNAVIQIIPWVFTAYPMILITVVLMYKNGDIVGATCNAVLSVVLMGQNFVKGIMSLIYFVADKEIPVEFARDAAWIDGCAYLVGAVMLVFIGWLAFMGCKIAGVSIWAAAIGFLGLTLMYFGILPIGGLIAGIGLNILAVWLIYSGIGGVVNKATRKQIFPKC